MPGPRRQWTTGGSAASASIAAGDPLDDPPALVLPGWPVPEIRPGRISDRHPSLKEETTWMSAVMSLLRGNVDGEKEEALAVACGAVGVAACLLVVFAYSHPKGKIWRNRVFGSRRPAPVPNSSQKNLEAPFDIKASANDRALKTLGVRALNLGSLPDGAEIVNVPNQVGGHKTMKDVPALLQLKWPGKGSTGRFILKILHDGGRGLVELGFYEKLEAHVDGPGARGVEPERTELESFLCPYYGAVKVTTDGLVSDNGDIVEGGTMFFLVIADMCSGFDTACVLDVKMGRTTVEPGEREEKRIGQLRKYPNQSVVGFRYVGMRWNSYYESGQQPQTIVKTKEWGAKMLVEETGTGLATFFHDGTHLRRGRVMSTLKKIGEIMDLFNKQKIFKFYASSILLTYDAADPEPEGGGSVMEDVEVRMIDFAHAVPMDGDGEDGKGPASAPADKGYLYGLKNLVGIMEELLAVTEGPDPPLALEDITSKLSFMGRMKADYVPDV